MKKKQKRLQVLISNDDGVYARGLEVLAKNLSQVANVTVIAPLEEKSTTGHSLTLHKPLRVLSLENGFYGVSGSPADCVFIGVRELLKRSKPDVVVSGINRGANLGQDIYYSGTVSAAREAAIMGIPSLAVSLAVDFFSNSSEKSLHYETAAFWAQKVLKEMGGMKFPEHCFLNLNVPDLPKSKVKELHLAQQGFRYYNGDVLKRRDHRGRPYFWVGGKYRGYRAEPGSDCAVVEAGHAALTPIQLDATAWDWFDALAHRSP